MQKIRLLALFTTLAVMASITVVIGAQEKMMSLSAALTGAAEVPGPGDADGEGSATVTVDPSKNEVCYELKVAKIEPATMAHIHEGAAGKAGKPKVTFDPPKEGTSKGCAQADAALIADMMKNPANYYVNVHNAEFKGGAVRGQLAAK